MKEKPTEISEKGDVQINVELMVTTIGIEGYRNILLKEDKQREVMAKYVGQTEIACSWDKFSKGKNATGKLFQDILGQMEDNNLKRLIERIREQKEIRGEMYVEADC